VESRPSSAKGGVPYFIVFAYVAISVLCNCSCGSYAVDDMFFL
jgi:hypothetical protein